MSKSKKELQKMAESKKLFQRHNVKKLYATSDGQFFISDNPAHLNARQKGKPGQPLAVYPLHEGGEQAAKQSRPSAEERIEIINQAGTQEEVDALLADEKAKTVLQAGAERKKYLETINHEEDES